MTPRPRFKRKHDVLIRGQSTKEDQAVDHAIAPFDRVAREMDKKWGVDVLPTLVTPELAARYGRTLGSLNAAIAVGDAERAADRASACIRGMAAMEAEAAALGHSTASPEVIIVDMEDGHVFGILTDERLWERAHEQRPDLRLYTLRELGVLIRSVEEKHPLIETAKQIPGAQVVAIRDKRTRLTKGDLDDEIPF